MTHKEIEEQAKQLIEDNFIGLVLEDFQDDDEGGRFRSTFMGTVFSIMPSGKYYQPYACSNVDPCPRCKGSGKSKHYHDCEYCDGQGENTFASIASFTGEAVEEVRERISKTCIPLDHDSFECAPCQGKGIIHIDCVYCQGVGSREALEDEWMQEALDEEAGKIGCYVTAGEVDPCDIFLGQEADEFEGATRADLIQEIMDLRAAQRDHCESCGLPIPRMPEDASDEEMLCDRCYQEEEAV